jgi:hypothetical protein
MVKISVCVINPLIPKTKHDSLQRGGPIALTVCHDIIRLFQVLLGLSFKHIVGCYKMPLKSEFNLLISGNGVELSVLCFFVRHRK